MLLCRGGGYNLGFGITLSDAVRNCMLFTESLQIAEVPQSEQYYSTIVFGCLVNKRIFEKYGCLLLMK